MSQIISEKDTIAAISTGNVCAGISVIRISGNEAVQIADRIFRKVGKESRDYLSGQRSHTIHYGQIMDGEELIDDVLVMLMLAPNTYTGEDTVEVNCHGGLFLTARVLDLIIRAGARLAEPGEFTRRAFLNGKMDLSRAEAVAELISSENERARKAAVAQLSGQEEKMIRKSQEKALYWMAFAEAALDDPEHISVEESLGEIKEDLNELSERLNRLCRTAVTGKLIKEGIRTVIVGKPNAGKSSLLNALLGEERAIVSDIAGTTRDTISEKVNLGTFTLNMIDTAGINRTDDPIERIGVSRAESEIDKADLVFFVMDGSKPLDENDRRIAARIAGKKLIVIKNKSDLETAYSEDKQEELFKEASFPEKIKVIDICATKGKGLDQVSERIEEMFFAENAGETNDLILLNKRHEYALSEALKALCRTIEGIDQGISEEFWLVDLKDVYDRLGEITGETVGENLIDEIFSKFCMGK